MSVDYQMEESIDRYPEGFSSGNNTMLVAFTKKRYLVEIYDSIKNAGSLK
jgi:hypothetical protein